MTLPVLYILMRNDLASMNMGKAIAQGSHAANAFVGQIREMMTASPDESLNKAFYEWENSTSQFCGTVLVLEAPMEKIYSVVEKMSEKNYIASVFHDPTYPLVDGQVVHHIPLDTCGYVFVPDKHTDVFAHGILGDIPLCR